jgi:hypothetical protein
MSSERSGRRGGMLLVAATVCVILASVLTACGNPGGGGGSTQVPAAPTGLAVSGSPTSSSVVLTWTAVTGATGYRVYRSATQTGTYAQAGSDVTAATFADSSLTAATTYWYKAAAFNSAGEGAMCTAISATTAASGGGPAVLWYGKGSIYLAVAGDNNDVKKYDVSDFDYNNNPSNAFLVDGSTGEFWYQASASAAWYKVVAGAANDVLLFAAGDVDVASPTQFLVLNSHLCYATCDASGHPTVYQVVAGASNDTALYTPTDFDGQTAMASGNQLRSAGGKLYYIFFVGSTGYLWEMVAGAGNDTQKYIIYPSTGADMDCGAGTYTFNGVYLSVSGEIWHNQSYTSFDLWKTVAGTGNDVQMFTQTADFDGQIVDHWSAGVPVLKKANDVSAPLVSAFPEVK